MSPGPNAPLLGRRSLLLGLAAISLGAHARLALAAGPPGDARLVVVILRGAMDGLHAVVPYGDPRYADLRRGIALPAPGRAGGVLDLGGFFGLHPLLAGLHDLYAEGALLVIHAVAGPYRTRSHFEGQDLLESGGEQRLSSGWLNRALAHLPDAGKVRRGLAVGLGLPLILRGPHPVGMWAPPRPTRPEADLYLRMAEALHDDPLLGPGVVEGLRSRGFTSEALSLGGVLPQGRGFERLASAAGRLLSASDGPRVAALELGGWDTHVAQLERMAPVLTSLDAGLVALRRSLGHAWSSTAVLCMTEFGRTAAVNGNLGTDHGVGGVAFLMGGAVAGGRVLSDWPGLGEGQLFEGRDLQPTRDLREIAKALLGDHLRLPPEAVDRAFPGASRLSPLRALFRAPT